MRLGFAAAVLDPPYFSIAAVLAWCTKKHRHLLTSQKYSGQIDA